MKKLIFIIVGIIPLAFNLNAEDVIRHFFSEGYQFKSLKP